MAQRHRRSTSETRYRRNALIVRGVAVAVVAVAIGLFNTVDLRSWLTDSLDSLSSSVSGSISDTQQPDQETTTTVDLTSIPAFDESTPYVELNGNVPSFTEDELTTTSFESYSELDSLGRCGVAFACLGQDLMPTEERGEIGSVKPTGWHTVRYDDLISDKYLYNRCHLIAFMLAGENANERNLITGTRYMNVTGMLPFESEVCDYIEETGNHVMYRVTPIFDGDNLVASGVQMEAYSVEDNGAGVCFNVYCYNAQPGITIDYATGDSWVTE